MAHIDEDAAGRLGQYLDDMTEAEDAMVAPFMLYADACNRDLSNADRREAFIALATNLCASAAAHQVAATLALAVIVDPVLTNLDGKLKDGG